MAGRHCESCTCVRRARVQGDGASRKGPGFIDWTEHELAWNGYAARYGREQSAEQIGGRGGFSYSELVLFLGREPETWEPASPGAKRERLP